MKQFIQPPDGIIITLPMAFFKEGTTYRQYLQELHKIGEDESGYWLRVCKNLPKQDVLYVYTIIGNSIRHRMMYAGTTVNRDFSFERHDGSTKEFRNANAIRMVGPVVMAPYKIPMRGFQGFRYTKKLF